MPDHVSDVYVGIDIGGAYTRLGMVDAVGRVITDRITSTPTEDQGEAIVQWLDDAYHACRDELDDPRKPVAIGVAVPGALEPSRTAVLCCPHLPAIEGLPLKNRLIERTGLPTFLDCAAVAAGWGEFCAREQKPRRFGYLSVGMSVSAAAIINGRVVRHTNHGIGHVGHLLCDTSADAPPCVCGGRGCLEAVAGAGYLAQAAEQAEFARDLSSVEVAYQEGDAAAAAWLDVHARCLAVAMGALFHLYEFDHLVVGGGVPASLPSLIRRAGAIAAETSCALLPQPARIELPALGVDSGLVGAAILSAEMIKAPKGR